MKKMKWNNAQEFLKTNTAFLEFGTDWCGTCQMMKPIIEKLESNIDIPIIKVDAEESKLFRDPKAKIQVLKIPAYYIVKNDEYIFIGYKYKNLEELINKVNEYK